MEYNRTYQSENSFLAQTIFSPSPFKNNVRLSASVASEISDFPEADHMDIPQRPHSVVLPRPGVVSLKKKVKALDEIAEEPFRISNHFNDVKEQRKKALDFEAEVELPQRTSNPIILNKGFELIH